MIRTFKVDACVEISDDHDTPQDGTLFRVIETGAAVLVVQQVSERTGDLIGVAVRCAPEDLSPARRSTLLSYAARRVQSALEQWRSAVDGDDEDVDSLDQLHCAAAALSELVIETYTP